MINASPLWSSDGARLVFRSNRRGLIELYEKSAFGGGNDEPVLPLEAQERASDYDLWLFPLFGHWLAAYQTVCAFFATQSAERRQRRYKFKFRVGA